jgi:hypothetical protein
MSALAHDTVFKNLRINAAKEHLLIVICLGYNAPATREKLKKLVCRVPDVRTDAKVKSLSPYTKRNACGTVVTDGKGAYGKRADGHGENGIKHSYAAAKVEALVGAYVVKIGRLGHIDRRTALP